MPWLQRKALQVSRYVPEPLLAQPERVFINLAAILLGVSALWPPPGSVADHWPSWFRLEWALAMVVGGAAALHGTWTGYPLTERLGAGLFACAALAFGSQAWLSFGWAGTGTTMIFVALASAKCLRIMRSLATTAIIAQSLRYRGTGDDEQ